MNEDTEVRVTSETGGQKGRKLTQISLVPPSYRREWIAKMACNRLLKEAMISMLDFEEGYGDPAVTEAALAEYIVEQINGDQAEALLLMGRIYGFGANKYDRINYLKGYDWSLTIDAFWRHMIHEIQNTGEGDEESGEIPAAHALWHASCLRIFVGKGLGTDDRIWQDGGAGYVGERE